VNSNSYLPTVTSRDFKIPKLSHTTGFSNPVSRGSDLALYKQRFDVRFNLTCDPSSSAFAHVNALRKLAYFFEPTDPFPPVRNAVLLQLIEGSERLVAFDLRLRLDARGFSVNFSGALSMGNSKISIVAYCLAVAFISLIAFHLPSKTPLTASVPNPIPVADLK
jgi:hypothetical protein